MKTSFKVAIAIFALIFGSAQPVAAESPALYNLLIVELQTAEAEDKKGNDFIEIYNPNAATVDITGWKLQYRSAASTGSWTTKKTISCEPIDACKVEIPPFSHLVIASYDILDVEGEIIAPLGFSDAGGQIRFGTGIMNTDPAGVHDLLGYGTAVSAETQPAPAPPFGKSLKRQVNEGGLFIDTDNNQADFIVGCELPTPGLTGVADDTSECEPDEPPADPDPEPEPEPPVDPGRGGVDPPQYLPVHITELLPDPASPQTDAEHEFIELYNPNDLPVNIKDYVVQTRSDFRYKFTIGDLTIEPHSYIAITSAQSKLSLSNSGSPVRILSPTGEIVDEAPNYDKAKEGQSWMKDDSGWHWTTTPTPGLLNTLTLPVQAATTSAKSKAPKKTAAKKKTAKKATSKKVAGKKKSQKSKDTAQTVAATPATIPPGPNYWLLGTVGTMAAGYAAYEYRQNIARGIRKAWSATTGGEK
ncbi:MAG: lamin tail domain-containing protein [Candidatus Saccharimonadales bacterium]